MTATDDYTPVLLRPRRSRTPTCGLLAVLVAITIVGLYMSVHNRYQVIGKTDPATGCRIEYTVLSRYRNLNIDDAHFLKPSHELEDRTYMPTPMMAPVKFFYMWILRRTDVGTDPDESTDIGGDLKAHEIRLTTFIGQSPNGHRISPDGYVEAGDIAGISDYLTHEKSIISNCLATWYSFDRTGADPDGKPLRYYNLYIRPKGKPITFVLTGISDSGSEPNEVLDEMTSIRDSIRVVKVR